MNIFKTIWNKLKGLFRKKTNGTYCTVTIWEKEDRDPWTISFDDREKANIFKRTAEKMIQEAGNTTLRVTMDSGRINDTRTYLEALAEELEVEIPKPEEPKDAEEDMAEFFVTRAVDGRYEAVVKVPRSMIPAKDAPRDVKQAFVDLLKEKAEEAYYEANFGDMHDVVGSEIVNITDENDNFIEDGGVMYL
jgi:hypothetical protein